MEKVPFDECFRDVTGGNVKIKQLNYLVEGEIPIIDQGKTLIGGFTNDENAIVKCKLPCVIFGDHSRNIKYFEKPFALGADGVKLLEATNRMVPKYGYYYLQTVKLPETGYDRSFKYLKRIQIPLPDLETQNKIVAILDKAKGILDKREKTIALYDELLRATFLEMFGDPFKLINKCLVPLNTVVNQIDSGWSPVCEETPRASSDQLAVLRQGAVSKRYFVPEQNKLLPYGLTVQKAIYARHKNLLFSRKNTPELVGATAYLFEDHENLLLPDTIFNIRYDESKISGVYLYYLFNNIEFRKKIQRLSVGQAKSMSNISQEKLLKLEIPLPDLDSQKEFEKIVTSSYSSVFAKLQKSKTGLERLLRSLSQQVFSERITIDVDTELEALVNAIDLDKKDAENKIDTIVNDITFAQRLIDRLEEQEFENHLQYDKAKYILFRILKEEEDLVKQIFKNNKVALTLQNETT